MQNDAVSTFERESTESAVDAFILFNEKEEGVASVVDELSNRGVRTYFWRRDIVPGASWVETENLVLASAKTVVVFLGSAGWGPTHRQLAVQAFELRKRIIPVLIGDAPTEALRDVGGIFVDLRYVDLRASDPGTAAAMNLLVKTILSDESSVQFDALVAELVNGNEEDRSAILQSIIGGAIADRRGLGNRLRDEIKNRYSPAHELLSSAVREPKVMPSIRSWMFSVLIWTDAEYVPNRDLILRHLDESIEDDRNVRFWVLAGLYQRRASYLENAVARSDSAPEVKLLAQALVALVIKGSDNSDLIALFRKMLRSESFDDDVWPALRVLRILPVSPLASDLCNLLDHSVGSSPLAYDVLYALANPPMAKEAASILQTTPGIDKLLDIIIEVVRNADVGASRHFVNLLAAFDEVKIDDALDQVEARDTRTAALIRPLRLNLRELRRRPDGPRSHVAGYASDAIDVTRDDLDIREDVQTLTAVMLAKEVVPPLAIGLFGDWGAGKSFFMRSIKAAVEQISSGARQKSDSKFCTDVVSIEFNAWHYADTNLWASLVSHILENLTNFVSPPETLEQKKISLVQQLGSTKQAISQIKSEQKSTEQQIVERQSELQKLQLEREQKEVELRDLRLTDLQNLLRDDPELQRDLKSALDEVGLPVVLSSFSDLSQAIAEVNSLRGRITGLAVGLFKARNGWLVALLMLAIMGLPVLGYWIHQIFQSSFVLLGTLVAQAMVFVGGSATLLSRAAGYVKRNLEKVEDAKLRVDKALAEKRKIPTADELKLQEEIASLKAKEEQTGSRLRAATEKSIELEQRIVELEKHGLAHFLTERAKSDDYRKHLGVISTIRRDFEALTSELMRPPTSSDANPRRVERIILYIDDLDRCPAEKVVEVLEAVHLLLAYPLFVVVVGVDPRWLAYSLTSIYPVLKEARAGDSVEASADARMWRPTPQNYLEKIFQIPFSLRPMTEAGYSKLVRGLLAPADRQPVKPSPGSLRPSTSSPADSNTVDSENKSPDQSSIRLPDIEPPVTPDVVPGPRSEAARKNEFTIYEEALVIRPVEEAFAERLYRLLPTPRATKRFSNIYRILKAPIAVDQLETFEGIEHAPGSFQVPMLLLAILIGMPSEATVFFSGLFDRINKHGSPADLIAVDILNLAPSSLREKIYDIITDGSFPRSRVLFDEWLRRVARFSFEIGRTIKPDSSQRKQG